MRSTLRERFVLSGIGRPCSLPRATLSLRTASTNRHRQQDFRQTNNHGIRAFIDPSPRDTSPGVDGFIIDSSIASAPSPLPPAATAAPVRFWIGGTFIARQLNSPITRAPPMIVHTARISSNGPFHRRRLFNLPHAVGTPCQFRAHSVTSSETLHKLNASQSPRSQIQIRSARSFSDERQAARTTSGTFTALALESTRPIITRTPRKSGRIP